jgi:hypothetical protein
LVIPLETLTAVATRDFKPTETPRPPTLTPAPTDPPTETPVPSPTPTQAPIAIEAGAERISRFGSGTVPRLADLIMLDPRSGWARSDPVFDGDDHVLTTSDAGQTWREVTPPQPINREWQRGSGVVLTALNLSSAWATFFDRAQSSPSTEAWVWRTTDGGATWEPSVTLPLADHPGYLPIELTFSDPSSGWLLAAVGGGGDRGAVVILETADGGLGWQVLTEFAPDAAGCQYIGLRRVSALRGYLFASCRGAIDEIPLVRETNDGGLTWTPLALLRPDGFPANFPGTCTARVAYAAADGLALTVHCRNADTGAEAFYLYSTDNGLQELTPVVIEGRLESVGFFSSGQGLLLVDTQPNQEGPLSVLAVEGGADITTRRRVAWRGQLYMVSATDGWALYSIRASGSAGFQLTTDGGLSWGILNPVVR